MKKYQSSRPKLRVGDTSSQKLQPVPNQSFPFPSSLATRGDSGFPEPGRPSLSPQGSIPGMTLRYFCVLTSQQCVHCSLTQMGLPTRRC